ncbi:disulfide bond formation protein B [Pseudomonas plecoglossicida]|uniref:disulfide bond formation protein B n=1 Tax=Pseudomonas plecoglossicida TaxID=70775 RepID=UPI003D248F25
MPARLRTFFLPGCLASLVVLAVSFYLEATLGLMPCPLCLSQRLLLGVYAAICLCAALHLPGTLGIRRYARAALACSALGTLLAARQVWLQGAGPASPVGSSSTWHLFEQPWGDMIRQLLLGGPDCSSLSWSFLDLTMPEWSLLAFVLLAVLPMASLLAYRFRTLGKT